ncbi:MAG: amino acid permease [Actinomycetota bacterium]|nr:amino acid permease [Actinomycetota bacterium]MDH5312693.1 amino acid permease [Actinomycetota bacterium]
MSERKVGSVTYKEVGEGYFEQRGLRRHAGVWSLWALGVGAVISGDYYGWNFGLSTGGFGGLLIATGIIAIMYYGLAYSIAEMSPALPHTGGAYSFARSAMGPWGGFLTGLAENAEYVITTAVVGGAIALLAQSTLADLFDITGDPWWNSEPFWWAVFYIVFLAINITGIEATMRFTIAITVAALAILIFFYVSAIVAGKVDPSSWFNIPDGGGDPLPDGGGPFLPFGISGIFKALPFAIWFYLAIEEVPLAAEESMDPRRDVPKGTIRGMHTLLIASLLTLFINSGVGGGASAIGDSGTPLFDGFKGVFGDNTAAALLGLFGLIGLVASFFTIMYAYGRNTYSLSRAGYFPQFLSKTHSTRKTPHVALIAGAIVGYVVLWIVWYLGRQEGDIGAQVVAAVLNMAVFAAVLAYTLQAISFILLRRNLPNIDRPYLSPWGQAGAFIAGVIALVALVSIFLNEDYRPGVYGVAVYFVLGIIYFAIAGRHRLVLSPEEEFALTQGEAGVPVGEQFSTSAEEQERILGGKGESSTPPPSG